MAFYFLALLQWSAWSVCNVRCEALTRRRTCRGLNCDKERLEESKPCLISPCSTPPPIYIQLRSEAVCLDWPRLKLTSHDLLTVQGNLLIILFTCRSVWVLYVKTEVNITRPAYQLGLYQLDFSYQKCDI